MRVMIVIATTIVMSSGDTDDCTGNDDVFNGANDCNANDDFNDKGDSDDCTGNDDDYYWC